MLAGGLGADNVRDAIEAVRPWAVDASSSLETSPGRQGSRRACAPTSRRRAGDADDLRRVRRPLRPRDARPGARRAGARAGPRRSPIPSFREELDRLGARYVGRPSPLYETQRFAPPGRRIVLKREDLNHTGAHKINNALGQVLLASRLGQAADRRRDRRRAARRGDRDRLRPVRARLRRLHGRGGHAPPAPERRAHAAPRRGGARGRVRHEDAQGGDERGDPRLDRERRDDVLPHRLLRRARSVPEHRARVASGDRTRGARSRCSSRTAALPDAVVACVGGGSNAIGLFAGFLEDADVRLVGVEAAGAASLGSGRPAASSTARAPRCSPTKTARCSTRTPSPPVSTTPASARSTRRSATRAGPNTSTATDEEALAAFHRLAETEGILPALEPAHALARAVDLDAELVLVGLSGRGDKDLAEVLRAEEGLVVYLMAGPDTPELAAAAEAGGADLVEIGFPFSDPLADGPVIRRAAEKALARRDAYGRSASQCLRDVRERGRRCRSSR